ncbi:MAG: thioredoxin domain-containing protein [Actinomycetota bacterium]
MDRVLLVLGAVLIAGVVAAVLGRKPGAPASNTHHVPNLLDRADFVRPEADWLVAVFTSATCNTCEGVWERAELLASDMVAAQRIDYQEEAALHERYRIDGVPTLVIADGDGTVKRAFLGPVTATDLWAAMAEEREPGSVPPDCHSELGGVDDGPEVDQGT